MRNIFNIKVPMILNDLFLNKNYTDFIKGFFMIFIVVGHIIQMLIPSDILFYHQILYVLCKINIIGVGCFFFFSGYGNYLSIHKRNCLKTQFKKCFSKIYRIYHVFFIALFFYSLMYFAFHNGNSFITYKNFLFYLLTLTIPGYTIWYLKVQVVAYIILFVSLFAKKFSTSICLLGTIFYILFAICLKISPLFWQTILCFPIGCFVAKYRNEIKKYLTFLTVKNTFIVLLILISCISFCFTATGVIFTMVLSVLGTFIVFLFSLVDIKLPNFIINLGIHSIHIYIYHWIYISIVKYLPFNIFDKILFIFLGIMVLLIILNKKEKIE